MALTLKSSGVATAASMVLAVEDDGSAVKECVSSAVNGDMVIAAGNGYGAGANQVTLRNDKTWKSVTRRTFETKPDGFGFYGIAFGTNKPAWDASSGHAISVFVAAASTGAPSGSAGTRFLIEGTQSVRVFDGGSGNKFQFDAAGGSGSAVGNTTIPTATKIAMALSYQRSTSYAMYYALESDADLTDDGTGTPSGDGLSASIGSVGGQAGQGSWPGEWFVVATFNRILTPTEMNSLHDDWFGTLFDTGGGGATPVLDEEGEWIIVRQDW